jgi:ribonucleotide reductase alpha subunit
LNKLNLSKYAVDLLKQRYSHKGESPDAIFKRVSKALAIRDDKFEKELYDLMAGGLFLPNSPCIRNAGRKKACLSACFVLPILDSVDGIFETLRNMALIFQRGGGTGTNFSSLRPKGASLTSGGTSSGVISFLQIFDATINTIKQGGFRKGASLATLDFDHPEITDFCRAKLTRQLTNFNLSVMVTDQFMKMATSKKNGSVELKHAGKVYNTIPAKDILDLIALGAWVSGDPGLLFFDRINKDNKYYPQQVIKATNPCIVGSTVIAVADGRNGVTIQQLAEEMKDVPVYSTNIETGRVEIRMGRNPRKTGVRQEVWKLVLDDDSSLIATPSHKILTKKLFYKELKNLDVGESIFPFYSFNSNAYRQISFTGSKTKTGLLRNRRQYQLIYEFLGGLYNSKIERLHHKDFNSLNDRFENIEKMTVDFHKGIHSQRMLGKKNPYHKMSKKWKFNFASHKGFLNGKSIDVTNNELVDYGKRIFYENGFFTRKLWIKYAKKLGLPQQLNNKFRFGLFTNFKNIVCENHKVKSIEFFGYEDVYNLTVDDNSNYHVLTSHEDENFVISSGICIKNCGEVPSLEYGACVLGSINLSKFVEGNNFNFDRFYDVAKLATRALLNINIINTYPIPQVTKVMQDLNSVGVGLMGFADCLIYLGIKYDSQECLNFIDKLCEPYIKATDEIAPDSFFKRSIAPTGSLSIIADCSAGIEPIFDTSFERRLTVGTIEETRDIYKSEFCRTAHQISPEWHLKIQGEFAKFIDAGVSKTINVPYNIGVEQIKKIFIDAWKMGVKGITIFREGSIDGAWVSTRDTSCEGDTCYL